MIFLVDENKSKSDKFLDTNKNFRNVKYEIEPGVLDPKILKYALEENCVLCTRDKKFALDALIAGVKVWYDDYQNKKDYQIIAKHVKF